MESTKIEELLEELVKEIRILTVKQKTEAFKKFSDEFLTSDLRKNMYDAFDGERTLQQISKAINCKLNTLQIFGQSLIDEGLVDFETKGNARIIRKSLHKVAIYYANKEIEEN
jgi:hypothetical protein